MNGIDKKSLELCERVDSLLLKATKDSDAFYDFATENEDLIKMAFLARGVVRELIIPLPELLKSIADIEEEFAEYVETLEDEDDDDDE